MRRGVLIFAWALVFIYLGVGSAFAQQTTGANDDSLGNVARQIKAQKAKESKQAKVITNDNIGTAKADATETASAPATKGKLSPDAAAKEPGAPAPEHDEEYYHSRLNSLQEQLDIHKRELSVLQQKLGQNQMQYYPDPNKSLMQQYSRDDINKLTADIDAKKKQIADDEKAIEDLHDQLRREGGDPGWLR
jgi:predicted RNase H-like nuclease (RuvC/YqgF family)